MESLLPPLRIVYWTRWFNTFKFDGKDLNIGKDCPVPEGALIEASADGTWCTISPKTDHVEEATAVVFHAADYFPTQVPSHTKNQPWILETMESPLTAPFRMDEEKMEVFDYLASYHLKSSFLFPYYSPSLMDVVNRPLPKNFMQTKTGSAPILWIAKNCGASSGRQYYVEQLMRYIQVDSYGSCLNNKPFPENKTRLELMAEYKFYLAIENANCDDYVTEKLFDTLSMSAVPIVDGPDSYDGFIPNKNAVIRMDDYPDPRDLAEYINYLDQNDTAYLEYLSFRRDALDIPARQRLDPSFIGNWSDPAFHNERTSWCSVCRGMVPWWRARQSNDDSIDLNADKSSRFLVDKSCREQGKWNYAADGPPYKPDWAPRRPPSSNSIMDRLPILPVDEHVEKDTAYLIWLAEILLGATFLLFIGFMMYKKHRIAAAAKASSSTSLPA